jgi:hypothetical protein
MKLEERSADEVFYFQLRCGNKIPCRYGKRRRCNKKVKIVKVSMNDIVYRAEDDEVHIEKTRSNILKKLNIEKTICEDCLNETLS